MNAPVIDNAAAEAVRPAAATISGAEMVVRALVDQGVTTLFGYPGGAVLPIYDALFHEPRLHHVLVRHEQGAVHAAEGYARTTGRAGVVLVTSGPGATNAVTGIVDALMDSVPLVVLTGQVPTHLIGTDAFQECDTVGITRSATKHNVLVRDVADLPRAIHEAFYIARSGRPGPVLIDIPKDVQFAQGLYASPREVRFHHGYAPRLDAPPAPHRRGGVDDRRGAAAAALRRWRRDQLRADRQRGVARVCGRHGRAGDGDAYGAGPPFRRPTARGSAWWACTGRTKPTTPCTTAT